MSDSTKELLVKSIENEFENLSLLEEEGESKRKIIENINTLYKLKIEDERIETENNDKINEIELKNKQLNDQKIDRLVNVGVQVGLSLLSIIAYDIWNRRGLKFEETGTITSPITRNLLSKMLPKR